MLKDATAAEIAAAVRATANNQAVCSPELCQVLFDYVARQRADFPNFVERVAGAQPEHLFN